MVLVSTILVKLFLIYIVFDQNYLILILNFHFQLIFISNKFFILSSNSSFVYVFELKQCMMIQQIHIFFFLFIFFVSIYLFIHLFIYLLIYLFIHLFIHLFFIYLFIYLFIYFLFTLYRTCLLSANIRIDIIF